MQIVRVAISAAGADGLGGAGDAGDAGGTIELAFRRRDISISIGGAPIFFFLIGNATWIGIFLDKLDRRLIALQFCTRWFEMIDILE